MALVTQRIWRSGTRRAKRSAWGYTVQMNGKQVRCFREEWSKEDAEKALAARQLGLTLGAMLETFLEARAKSKRNKSVGDDRERSRPLLAFFGADTPVSAITTARVADYRLHRAGMKSRLGKPLSPTTINRECQVLRGAFNLALRREEVGKVPRFTMEAEAARERWLTVAEIEALVTACRTSKNPWLAGLVLVGMHTGLRLSELTGPGMGGGGPDQGRDYSGGQPHQVGEVARSAVERRRLRGFGPATDRAGGHWTSVARARRH
jgi:hypothetical protein